MVKDYSEADTLILTAIRSFDGIPNPSNLSKTRTEGGPVPYSQAFIRIRFLKNAQIRDEAKKRAFEYLDTASMEKLSLITNNPAIIAGLSKLGYDDNKLLERLWLNVDKYIMQAVESYEGIVTPYSFVVDNLGSLPFHHTVLSRRLKENRELAALAEQRSISYITNLSLEDLDRKVSDHGFMHSLPAPISEVIYARIDNQIIETIQRFNGIPNSSNLSRKLKGPLPFSQSFVSKRFKANSRIREAYEERAVVYVSGIPIDELNKKILDDNWLQNLPSRALAKTYERIDSEIEKAIREFNGIPYAYSLSRKMNGPLPYSDYLIYERFKANSKLIEAAEERAIAYIKGCDINQFVELRKTFSYETGPSAKIVDAVNKRLDLEILRGINKSGKEVTIIGLSSYKGGSLPFNRKIVTARIYANPMLWQAYYRKKGLTPDQAVELALERENNSVAAKLSLVERLENLHAFREILGVIRCFQDLFRGAQRIIEFSLYPSPVSRAEEVLGSRFNLFLHSNLRETRLATMVQDADLVVVQGLHRVKDINALLSEIKQIAELQATIILTYRTDYFAVDTFEELLERAGFSITEQGMIETDAPSVEQLLEAGVSEDDLSRVRAKVRGKSNVLVLTNERASDQINVPSLVKIPKEEVGRPLILSDAISITTPREVLQTMGVKFVPELVFYPSEPLLVEVVDGDIGVAVIGYDMNKERPRRVEVDVYPGAPSTDIIRSFARRLSRHVDARKTHGITSRGVSRVQVRRLSN